MTPDQAARTIAKIGAMESKDLQALMDTYMSIELGEYLRQYTAKLMGSTMLTREAQLHAAGGLLLLGYMLRAMTHQDIPLTQLTKGVRA